MKTYLQFILSSVAERSLMGLAAVVLAVLALNAAALAATPVDIYQDMENGNAGDVLTAAIMNGSSHGGGGWSYPAAACGLRPPNTRTCRLPSSPAA